MNDLRQDSQTGMPTEYFALCSAHFEELCFSRSVLIGTPADFKRFYLRKVQYHRYTRSRKIHWALITQEMREDFQVDFSPRNSLWKFLWDSPEKRQYPKSPFPKKFDSFSDWVGLFEICFRSSKMTGSRPCPTGWDYCRALSRSTKTCQAQTNNKLSTEKIDIS